jgi:hypothetical protein
MTGIFSNKVINHWAILINILVYESCYLRYLGNTPIRQYIRVDRVNYSDGSHPENCPGGIDLWPVEADGNGMALKRKVLTDYGDDPENWIAAVPSPGE